MGVTLQADGANFAVFSQHATALVVCVHDASGAIVDRHPMTNRTGDIWHGFVPGLPAGTLYSLRADGPWAPGDGHRFDPEVPLFDPYATSLQPVGNSLLCRIDPPSTFDWKDQRPPSHAWHEMVIYEAHPRGLTMQHPAIPADQRGTFAALGSDAMIDHLKGLGITTLELLPVMAFADEPFLTRRGLSNYWGYNTIGFFAPHPAYGTGDDLRGAIRALHAAGIEVILDVVYNHSGEGDLSGNTWHFRGLDNARYYRLEPDGSYVNDTGCGNTLNTGDPAVLRMVMDSLRHWVTSYHLDGFRFDLAVTLAREADGFDPAGRFMAALLQDPVLSRVKLIAEPWDIGPGGYQRGAFPAPFAEWNDACRDAVRRFWRGDAGAAGSLAGCLLGSADAFDRAGRAPGASVNFITAHDGFTLNDLVSYRHKHNDANGEHNRDGHHDNLSTNAGIEGPTPDPTIVAARDRRRRALLATLLLAQGTPMLLAGDELGNSQGGNNNAYCQDNATGWVDWDRIDVDFLNFARLLTTLRRRYRVVAQDQWLHGCKRADGSVDVEWFGADGKAPDWEDPQLGGLGLILRPAAGSDLPDQTILLVINRLEAMDWTLPDGTWQPILDSARPSGVPVSDQTRSGRIAISGMSVSLFSAV